MARKLTHPGSGGWVKHTGVPERPPSAERYPSQTVDNDKPGSKIFLICPVRNVKPEVKKRIEAYVTQLEDEGYDVYWPARDTDQNDPVGITICETNRAAIERADAIHIWFDLQSQGSLFDIGMTFAFLLTMQKRIVIANRDEVQRTPHKSFQNVLLELSLRTRA